MANKTEIAKVNEQADFVQSLAPSVGRFSMPENREQVAMLAELDALDQQLQNLDIATTKPSELAESGVVFDILDVYPAEIRDGDEMKTVACFKIVEVETGLTHLVMQGLNSIREVYVKRFGGYKALGAPQEVLTMRGYQFVESDNPKHRHAGNSAIILKKVGR